MEQNLKPALISFRKKGIPDLRASVGHDDGNTEFSAPTWGSLRKYNFS
jgi:hypothetical protein